MKHLQEAAKVLKHVYGQSELARLFNVSPQMIHNWQARGISKQGMLKTQETVGCSASWPETGTGQMFFIRKSSVRAGNNSRILPITSEQAIRFGNASSDFVLSQESCAWLFAQLFLSAWSFSMKMSGSTMAPELEEGDGIIVNPMAEPEPGDFVVARCKTKDKDTAILRKYRPHRLDASHKMLLERVPLNDGYPCIRLPIDSVDIIGTVAGHRKFREKSRPVPSRVPRETPFFGQNQRKRDYFRRRLCFRSRWFTLARY